MNSLETWLKHIKTGVDFQRKKTLKPIIKTWKGNNQIKETTILISPPHEKSKLHKKARSSSIEQYEIPDSPKSREDGRKKIQRSI